MSDGELDAMRVVSETIQGLDEAARGRVLRWVAEKYEVGQIERPVAHDPRSSDELSSDPAEPAYAEVGDLVHAAAPRGGPEYALAVAYWLQMVDGKPNWGGGDINNILKNLGHGLPNVTKTLNSLIGRKPSLVMQTAKTGRSRQARKTYKLTAAGVIEAQRMLEARPEDTHDD